VRVCVCVCVHSTFGVSADEALISTSAANVHALAEAAALLGASLYIYGRVGPATAT